jgi:hypothetical protein
MQIIGKIPTANNSNCKYLFQLWPSLTYLQITQVECARRVKNAIPRMASHYNTSFSVIFLIQKTRNEWKTFFVDLKTGSTGKAGFARSTRIGRRRRKSGPARKSRPERRQGTRGPHGKCPTVHNALCKFVWPGANPNTAAFRYLQLQCWRCM